MPLSQKARYRFRQVSPTLKQKLNFVGNGIIEVRNYYRLNEIWVRSHLKRKVKI